MNQYEQSNGLNIPIGYDSFTTCRLWNAIGELEIIASHLGDIETVERMQALRETRR